MATPCASICTPWATTADLCEPCDDYAADFAAIEDWLIVASEVLFERTGRRWPGHCKETVRPCARAGRADAGRPAFPSTFGWHTSSWVTHCGCAQPDRCACSAVPAIELPSRPVTSITQVKLDGVVLGASAYRVDDFRWLVRANNADGTNDGWPCCASLLDDVDDTDGHAFQVTYTYGQDPPMAGARAAAMLACELWRGCTANEACALPDNVTRVSRQGVDFDLIAAEAIASDTLGIKFVDDFLATYNPNRLQSPLVAVNPDMASRARTVGTGG